ncbi:MAG: histidine phosphatase family protein [Lachnospiraceae bacterium]|nr:histidine phosphatase family protein [Lachnospiraceae bacterium]
MKLIFIRHGDPDYSIDSLTAQGFKEAELLAEFFFDQGQRIDECYVSSLGRAKDTASFTCNKYGIEAKELEWLKEFPSRINRPDVKDRKMICWDWLPQDWTKEDEFYSYENFADNDIMEEGSVGEEYRRVTGLFDEFLAQHGYVHDGRIFRVTRANDDNIVIFAHFGSTCVMLSHLLHISPMVLWHGFAAAPTSVTRVVTEERRKGIASFRILSYGDISHLNAAKVAPSIAARFCETYDNEDERHD